MKRTKAKSNALPIIGEKPLKYSDAVIWFSDLARLKVDGYMENLERYELRRETGQTASGPFESGDFMKTDSSAEVQAVPVV